VTRYYEADVPRTSHNQNLGFITATGPISPSPPHPSLSKNNKPVFKFSIFSKPLGPQRRTRKLYPSTDAHPSPIETLFANNTTAIPC
jgi:hypothetical protein